MPVGTNNADFLLGDDPGETIFGLAGNDLIFGKGGDDFLFGQADDDILVGGLGDDTLNGGIGNDTASYYDQNGFIHADLSEGKAVEFGTGGGFDILIGIENLTGSKFDDGLAGDDLDNILDGREGNDSLQGHAGNDTLLGGKGNDHAVGGAGADLINGGDGTDSAQYYDSDSAVKANLSTGSGSGGTAEGDTYLNVEDLVGSDFGDVLTGNGADNHLDGRQGNDVLKGGDGDDWLNGYTGNDTLNGGAGSDTIEYWSSSKGVQIDLAANTANGGLANGDIISNVENIQGSNFNDKLSGNGEANTFWGQSGNDQISGRGGDDFLVGWDGQDTLTGGTGADTFYFLSDSDTGITAATRDIVTDFESGVDVLKLSHFDGKASVVGVQKYTYIGDGAFTNVEGQLHIRSEGGNTFLEGDRNGDGAADFQIQFNGTVTFTVGVDLML